MGGLCAYTNFFICGFVKILPSLDRYISAYFETSLLISLVGASAFVTFPAECSPMEFSTDLKSAKPVERIRHHISMNLIWIHTILFITLLTISRSS